MKTIETLSSPFKHLVMTIGELPTTFVESMSYYEALAWLVNYMEKTLLPAVNENAEATKELQEAFIILKDYVDNYLDNLDLQEDINNKLDEMAEDGTLADIINQQIFDDLNDEITGLKGDDIKYHFVKTGDNLGDCTLVQIGEKNILIDLSASTTEATLLSYLSNLGVTHIDALIISHFHYDHIGGANAEGFGILCNAGLINSETAVYVPKDPNWNLFVNDIATETTNVVGRVTGMIAAFENIATAHDITITRMITGNEVTIENTKLRFLNCNDNQYVNYYNVTLSYDDGGTLRYYTDYNNFSMIVLIEGKCPSLFTGDINVTAEEVNDAFINRDIKILKVPHHGVNNDLNAPFAYKAIGDVNVIMNTAALTNPRRAYLATCLTLGKKVYSSEKNNSIVIEDKFGTLIDNNEQYVYSKLLSGAIGFDFLKLNGVYNLGMVQSDHIIRSDSNLNDFDVPGVYQCQTSAIAATLSNKPSMYSETPFNLVVSQGQSEERLMQELHSISPYNEVFVRWYGGEGSGWSKWTKQGGDYANFGLTAGTVSSGATIAMSKTLGTDVFTYDGGAKIGLPGAYEISGQITLTSLANGVTADVQVIKNSTRIQRAYATGSGGAITISLPTIINAMTNNDVLKVQVVTTDSSDISVNANSQLILKKVA